jgi:CBS domain-containing protein
VNDVPPDAPRLVGDLMTAEPIVVAADASLPAAARLMDRHQISGLPVVDQDGSLVGVISDADLLRARATEYLWASRRALRVRHVMTSPALVAQPGQPLDAAAHRMERHHVSLLVVVAAEDETRPVGVICSSDLVRAWAALPDDARAEDVAAPR